ncbi:hypothetical protein [Calothrix sp. PCC 7507]|uniref:hypothetical protein n=1 Tax=Calothrix sp. PCC 7507 TaxID=99598 RepID=UPI0019174095|nr:hypothetical protein [Calothrix sp. PCC 7507]
MRNPKRLQVNLGYLCNKGLASLTSGIFEKLEDDFYELRMTKSQHNPRFILTADSSEACGAARLYEEIRRCYQRKRQRTCKSEIE